MVRAQQEYEEPAWSRYDEVFREKAASIGNRKWSQIDTHIYNQVFTGRPKKRPMCAGCGSTCHDSSVCPEGHSQGKKFMGSSQPGGRVVARSFVPNVASVMISTTKESAVMGLLASSAICVYSAWVVIQLVTVKRD